MLDIKEIIWKFLSLNVIKRELDDVTLKVKELKKLEYQKVGFDLYKKEKEFVRKCLDIDYEKLIEKYKYTPYKELPEEINVYLMRKYKLEFTHFDYNYTQITINEMFVGDTSLCLGEILENIKGIEVENAQAQMKLF